MNKAKKYKVMFPPGRVGKKISPGRAHFHFSSLIIHGEHIDVSVILITNKLKSSPERQTSLPGEILTITSSMHKELGICRDYFQEFKERNRKMKSQDICPAV